MKGVGFFFFLLLAGGTLQAQIVKLEWAAHFGGPGDEFSNSIAVDPAGNVYSAGQFQGTVDFDPGPGVANLTSVGVRNLFVSKVDASGAFVWVKQIQSNSSAALTVTATNVYITGPFTGTVDFDPGPLVTNLVAVTPFLDAYVTKWDVDGNFIWARKAGSAGANDYGTVIRVDGSGNVLVTGLFQGTVTFGTTTLVGSSGFDIYVWKLDGSGTHIWAKRLGGTGDDQVISLTLDPSGNPYLTGYFTNTADFDPGAAVLSFTSNGFNDIFVVKLDASGNLGWAKQIGGTLSDNGASIAVDNLGNVVSTGFFRNTPDFDPGAGSFPITSAGSLDAYILQLDASGNFIWAKAISGISTQQGSGISTDPAGNIYATGGFSGDTDFDPGPGVLTRTAIAATDGYILKLNSNGDFVWVQQTGGASPLINITVNPAGNIYTVGSFNVLTDIDPGSCVLNFTPLGNYDVFIQKFIPTAAPSCVPTITSFSPASGPVGTLVTITGTNFNPNPASNIIYFGANSTEAATASSTELTAVVPTGATFQPITVSVVGLTAYSNKPFLVTFADGGVIDACSFDAPNQYSSGNFGYALALGDLDLDGRADIVVTNPGISSVQIFRNTSTPSTIDAASLAPSLDLPVGANPLGVTVSDLDGDGRLDIIVTSRDVNTLSVFRNISSPGSLDATSFAARVDFVTPSTPIRVACQDLDGDGRTDIVAGGEVNALSIWRNIGLPGSITTGSFDTRVDIATSSYGLAIADIDVDGKPDLISGNSLGASVGVLRNISTPGTLSAASFAAPVSFTVGAWIDYIAIGDLDNDARPDILTSSWPDGAISILKNTSSPGPIAAGSFAPRVVFSGHNEPRGVNITDYDGDGFADIAVANQISGAVTIYKNITTPGTITTGSFAPRVDFPTGGNLRFVLGGDIDGDGKPDLVATNWSGPPLSVVRNTVSSLPPPTITSFSPGSGQNGTSVTITGTNFSANPLSNTVKFNGATATVTVATSTSLTVTVPANATTGTITVKTGCSTATSGSNFVVTSCIPISERNALVALYNSTVGTSWTDNSGWLSGDESTWHGVTAAGCHISEIDLNTNNLVGTLPVEIGDFPELTFLKLSANQITGGLPSTVVNLSNLEYLKVDNNQLSGPLPANIGTMPSLIELVTQNNAFNGPIPASLAGCTTLQNLHLEGNQHDGSIPSFLGGLFNLRSINIAFNQFTNSIPPELGNLANLSYLSLAGNQLYGSIPVELANLDELELLDMSRNQLSSGIPPELGGLGSLKYLFLWQNNLSDVIPDELGDLINLRELDLSHNFFEGAVPSTFTNLTLLNFLSVADNGLVVIPNPIGDLPALERVDFSHNFFADVPVFTSGAITQLSVEYNNLDFAALERNIGATGYTYNPQYLLPPGGVISYVIGGFIDIFYDASGSANSYQWYKGVAPEPGQTTSLLSKTNLTAGDAGFYILHITSSVVPGITLETIPYLLYTDPCGHDPGTIGDIDTSFDAQIDNPTRVKGVELQSTGKAVVAIESTTINSVSVTGIIRFNLDGSLDNSFNQGYYSPNGANELLVQPDDKILVTDYGYDAYIIRLNEDGTSDNTFNSNAPSYYSGLIRALALQPDGKILVVRQEYMGTVGMDRLNPDGTMDGTFSSPEDIDINVVQVQSDGKILIGGDFTGGIKRLNEDGSDDISFDPGSGANYFVLDIAVQPDGKIIATGAFDTFNGLPAYRLVRLNPDGSVDPSFNALGLTVDLESTEYAYKILLRPDGKILLGGNFFKVNGATREDLVRLNADGTVDCIFDSSAGVADETIYDMSLQPDGGIVIAGDFITYDGTTRNGLARVNGGGSSVTITQQPADVSVCDGLNATFSTNATGTTNIAYQWQYSLSGAPATFADISDGANYTGTGTNTLVVNTTGTFGAGRYRCRINGDAASEVITYDEGLFINALPPAPGTTGNTGCSPASLLLTATGGSPGQYIWYTMATGIISGAVNGTYTTTPLSTTTLYYVAINNGTCQSSYAPVTATVLTGPLAPVTTGATNCGSGSLLLSASGGTNGEYRWYTVSTGGSPIPGEVNGSYTTPLITTTTSYFVALNNGTCEGSRSTVVATINTIPAAPVTTDGTSCGPSNTVTLNATGGAVGQYRWYSVSSGGTPIPGAVNSSFTTPTLSTTTVFYAAINNGFCESSRTPATANIIFCNQTPVIAPATATVPIDGSTSIALLPLVSDPDNNLDLATLTLVGTALSGAPVSISNGVLSINYAGIAFSGTDQITIRVCDVLGACAQQVMTIEVAGDIIVYEGISPNGDGPNDTWIIRYIELIPDTRENKVTIFNRWGDEVFSVENYNNQSRVFAGRSSSGDELASGTYFYKIHFSSGREPMTGYLTLKR